MSLDAPLVSVLWQALLARVVIQPLQWPHATVLGVSVWLAYAADRWIEGWRLDRDAILTPRHRFYQRFRWPVAMIWILACVADVWLAFKYLSRLELAAGFVLLAAVAAYLLSHQLVHRHRRWRLPKEVIIAALLGVGVALFLIDSPRAIDLMTPLALFALLCFANTALISVWERHVDRAHGQTSLAVDYASHAQVIHQLPWLIGGLAALTAAVSGGTARTAAICAAASALLLAVIDAAEARTGHQLARVLSDLALMSPVVPLLWS
jgi:hypothetical protein